jgi:hypothetical protein
MPYFNFYAAQARRLQALVPDKKITYEGLDPNFLFIEVDGKPIALDRRSLRKMVNLPVIAKSL